MSQNLREQLMRWIRRQPMRATPRVPMAKAVQADAANDCPLPGCETCPPSVALDVVADMERMRQLAYASAWLINHWPDAWYYDDAEKLRRFAAGILELRVQLQAGRLAR